MADAENSNQHLLIMIGGAGFALVLLALTVALVLVFALRSDVATLEEQVRKSAKATKAMQEEVASLKEIAETLAAQQRTAAQAQAQNIDAADTSADCVIGSGTRGGLPDCMKIGPGR